MEGKRGDNQICIGYKNQFDVINEKNGDTLQLYRIDNSKVNLVSAVDIYEDDESELILCYNHVSHFQRLREEISHDFDFTWNSEPLAIVCAFPYIMAFTTDTIEIRLMINGNLVHTMTMPDLNLVTSKCDFYFASTASSPCSPTDKGKERDHTYSPPPSPKGKNQTTNIYKISMSCLAGQISVDKAAPVAPQPGPPTLLAPVNTNGDKSPSIGRRSPLTRTKRAGPVSIYLGEEKDRHDSSSSDSGILSLKPNDFSPPISPMGSAGYADVYDQETDLV